MSSEGSTAEGVCRKRGFVPLFCFSFCPTPFAGAGLGAALIAAAEISIDRRAGNSPKNSNKVTLSVLLFAPRGAASHLPPRFVLPVRYELD